MVLAESTYFLTVSGQADPANPYTLKIDVTGEAVEGFEAEPNETVEFASPLRPEGDGFASAGRLGDEDSDVFGMTVSGEPQLWMIEADGPGISTLSLLDTNGRQLMSATVAEPTFVIYDAYLLPGDHYVRVFGYSGDYTLTVTPLGPPDPSFELEPNDSIDRSQPITLLEERMGRLASRQDVDTYRFSLQGDTYLTLTVEVPTDGLSYLNLDDGGAANVVTLSSVEPGQDLVWSGWLPAGDYTFRLSPTTVSQEPYRVSLTPGNPFQLPDDLEPNDDAFTASPLPASWAVSGTLDPVTRDTDWYTMEPFDEEGQVVVTYPDGITVNLRVFTDDQTTTITLPAVLGTEAGQSLVNVPAGQLVFVEVTGSGPYDIRIDPLDQPGSITGTPAPGSDGTIVATLDLGEQSPAAYWATGQVVEGSLTLENTSNVPVEVRLSALTGHADWRVAFSPESVSIGPGEQVSADVAVHVAPDSRADQPIFVAVEAASDDLAASATGIVTPGTDAPPLNPEPWDPVPANLLGGLNVAWMGLGASPVTADEADLADQSLLFNELISTGDGIRIGAEELPADLTIDLAGEEPVPVVGIVLFPVGSDTRKDMQLAEFELELSMDGATFTPVLGGRLDSRQVEQVFVLDSPMQARFARLRVISPLSLQAGGVTIGEWKVIAEPGWTLPAPLNIADPLAGGHVVTVDPPFGYTDQAPLLLSADGQPQEAVANSGTAPSITIGFHHNRAARITSLEWLDPPESDPAARFGHVLVETSTSSPVGPWTAVGEYELERDSAGRSTVTLDDEPWARFIRITAVGPGNMEEGSDTVTWELPDQITVFELPADDSYRSVPGEWGTYRSDAFYERSVNPDPVSLDEDAGNDAGTATTLSPDVVHTDSAAVTADEDWFEITVPAGEGILDVTLEGIPALGVTATLLDAEGNEIPVTVTPVSASVHQVRATVEPGATYHLRVTQPPTSVVFAFDTSASIGALEPAVYQGLTRFAGDVLPGREAVNILPFGERLLLDEWVDDPYFLQSTIINYPRTSVSSDAEGAIVEANAGLIEREGNRAIILITDAENGPIPESLWSGLESTAPRIFAVHISGTQGSPVGQDLLQDWSMVNSGNYVYVRSQGEMDVAFSRAATELRRPSIYSISYQTAPPEPSPTPAPTPTPEPTATPEPTPTPEPDGSIQVLAPPVVDDETVSLPAPADGQVAIILDTSGSMLQDLEGQTRADVAKTSLIDLVTTTIPAGTTVSLRTFGDTPDSCETILAVPASPLDPTAMADTIANLPIVNLVRTPIGAALEAVAGDLTGTGPKIVVLVTDGEETCDGDPAAAIQALTDSGVDVRVNIVGFAIDDPALQATFTEWARLGNGQYIDAGNADELNSAVAQAVMPTFDVVDLNGSVVASGQVGGDAVAIPPGTYQVVIRSNPEIVIDDVTVSPGQPTSVTIPGG